MARSCSNLRPPFQFLATRSTSKALPARLDNGAGAESCQRRAAVAADRHRRTPQSGADLQRRVQDAVRRVRAWSGRDGVGNPGRGHLNVDGDKWRHQRRVTSHLFSMHMLKDYMNAVVREKTVKLRDVLALCADRGDPVSMKSLLNKFTADVFTRIGLGVELNGLDEPVDVDTTQPVDAALQVVQSRLQSPVWLWKLRRLLNVGGERVLRENMKRVHDTIQQIMAKSLDGKQLDDSSNSNTTSHKD
ncbi:unnamed protein product [Phytophthora lilii]|uniref:Unnamed protein product n=1 Tax=Phytophthora lilii TaxID=2077276 RepID=A0A9W6TD06_9STRA|nr:unnamed protein product [Phytophthora lilii]